MQWCSERDRRAWLHTMLAFISILQYKVIFLLVSCRFKRQSPSGTIIYFWSPQNCLYVSTELYVCLHRTEPSFAADSIINGCHQGSLASSAPVANAMHLNITFPCINWNSCSRNCSSCMILSTKNIATRPLHLKKKVKNNMIVTLKNLTV